MNRTTNKLKRYSACLRKWTRSNAAYALLDVYIPGASDWGAGGCAPLAIALHRLMPGSTLWVVVSSLRPERAHHVLVKWQGLFWDYRGGRQKRSVEQEWQQEFTRPGARAKVVPATEEHQSEVGDALPCPAALVNEVVRALAACT
jgi:hypothetical protein